MPSATVDVSAPADLVRAYFSAFLSKDSETVERLLADDFTFTSPYDDHIDKATYFARCWPASDVIRDLRIERVVGEGDHAFVKYEVELEAGTKARNTEHFVFRGGKLASVEVYFGDPPIGLTRDEFREMSGTLESERAAKPEIRKVLDAIAEALRRKDVEAKVARQHVSVPFDMEDGKALLDLRP